MQSMGNIAWIESAGGPLVVLPLSKMPLRRGIETEDYADACKVEDYAGILDRPWGRVAIRTERTSSARSS